MEQSTAQRRLVKSPPELWAQVSSEHSLRRHLSEFGEIRITRVEPETTVAWEGDRASGTVELAPAGWGTKVVLTATPAAPQPIQPQPARPPVLVSQLVASIRPEPERRRFVARFFHRPSAEIPAPGPPPDPGPPAPAPTPPPPAPAPTPPPQIRTPALDGDRTVAILSEVLDDLGGAHHRPFSRD